MNKNTAKTVMNTINSKKKFLIILSFNLLITILIFQGFFRDHYSIDSFNVALSYQQGATFHITNGRFFATILILLIDKLGISLVNSTCFWIFLFDCVLSICCVLVTNQLAKNNTINDIVSLSLISLATLIGFDNIFISEWFQFIECAPIYMFAIACAVIGAIYFKKQGYKNKLVSMAFLILAYNTYQIVLGIWVFLVLIFIIYEDEKLFINKKSVCNISTALAMVTFTFISNLLCVKYLINKGIIAASRYEILSLKNIWENFIRLMTYQKKLWLSGNGMAHTPFFFVFFLICIFILAYIFFREKTVLKNILYFATLLAGGIAAVFAPMLIPEYFTVPSRQIVPLPLLFTFLLIYIANSKETNCKYIAVIASIVFLVCSYISIDRYADDTILSNTLDKLEVTQIQTRISDYEKNTNQKIDYIGFGFDALEQWRWPEITSQYPADLCTKAFSATWARINIMNYYTNQNYKEIEVPEEIKNYYLSNDWNMFDPEEQIIFSENCCYICIY